MQVGYGKRITGARETIELVRDAAGKEVLTRKGEVYHARGYHAFWSEDPPPRVFMGASGPKMIRMATEAADGLMMSDIPPVLMDERLAMARAGMAANQRSPDDFRISNFWAWHVKKDKAAARWEASRELMIRGWLEDDWIRPFLDEEEMKFVRQHIHAFLDAFRYRRGEIKDIPERIIDALLEGLTCTGEISDMDRHIEKLRRFKDGGFDELGLRVHDHPADGIRMLGQHVLPALQ